MRFAGDLAQDFWLHPACGSKPTENFPQRYRVRRRNLSWFLGLALLLIVLKGAGREVTWGGFQFTNPYFVLVLSVVVLVFALNLFGVFEVSLPQSGNAQFAIDERAKELPAGFLQGVFATVLATPCTAPFLGRLLASRSPNQRRLFLPCSSPSPPV